MSGLSFHISEITRAEDCAALADVCALLVLKLLNEFASSACLNVLCPPQTK